MAHPAKTHYFSNGSGRDHYIAYNNGGMVGKNGAVREWFQVSPMMGSSTSFLRTGFGVPGKPKKPFSPRGGRWTSTTAGDYTWPRSPGTSPRARMEAARNVKPRAFGVTPRVFDYDQRSYAAQSMPPTQPSREKSSRISPRRSAMTQRAIQEAYGSWQAENEKKKAYVQSLHQRNFYL